MSKTVLITGGAGYIGSHVQYYFLDQGFKVIVLDNLSQGHLSALSPETIFYKGDIQDTDLLDTIFSNHSINGVLHFAASVVVSESVQNPLKYYENNFINTEIFIKSCLKHKVQNFIFSSTAAVYGIPDHNSPISETEATGPISPYGRSKLMVEWLLKDLSLSQSFPYCALRYFNVAGADPNLRTGQLTKNATHLIKVICEVLTKKRAKIDIYGSDYPTPDGTCVRDYIHVTDLAEAHYLVFEHLEKTKESITFNCGYNQGFSVKEVISVAESISNQKIDFSLAPRREGDSISLTAQSNLIRTKLKWTPKYHDLPTIIQSAYAWEQKISQKAQ